MLGLTAYIHFDSAVDLEATGRIVSEILFGGIEFDYETGLRDELDGLVIKRELLGLRILLYGAPADEGDLFKMCIELFPGESRFNSSIDTQVEIGGAIAPIIEAQEEFAVTGVFPKGRKGGRKGDAAH